MEKSKAEIFLNKHRCIIIENVRKVDKLVDFLTQSDDNGRRVLSKEMVNNISAKDTEEEKMREVYKQLNCNRGFELTLTWLKKNEPFLIEALESRQTTSEAPPQKRFRSSEHAEDVDETDLNKPSLKTFSTLAKLERWVSDSKNSQDLMDKLEKRIQTKGLEALKEQLKNMKIKKDLCFTGNEVRKIESNQKLSTFFQNLTNAEFPKVALEIFFQNKAKNDFMPEKDIQNDSGRYRDSGYNSFNNSQFDSDNSSLLGSAAFECMENNDSQHNELNMSEIKAVDIYVQHLNSVQSTKDTNDQTQTGREDYKSLDETTEEMQETGYKPSMVQSEQFQSTTPVPEVEVRQIGSGVQMQDAGDTALGICCTRMDTQANYLPQTKVKPKIRQNPNDNKFKKMKEQRKLLYAWAEKKCSREENVEKEVEEVFSHMSFENIVEHREYPCFTAEHIMIYTDPQTQERQIIYFEGKNCDKNLSKDTKIRVNYQMWVCGIEQAVVIMNQGDGKIIEYESFDSILQRCERLVFEALAPALAVFKNLQRQEKFFSLIKNH
ncbi:hypothetical protein AMEX_G1901 [Astyanax mexicanus]|uniref:CARD domain-containing protein n=1 Tax=Astyanax mexicanus TaxID=7994 RepID=A0A8T2MN23_ASTMX|nr:hypothetical protein AMEX_G1901 [Astyanax mexicanus]